MQKFVFFTLICLSASLLFTGCSDEDLTIDLTDAPQTDTVILHRGDVLVKTFEQTKLQSNEAFAIMNELKKLMNINKCKPNDFYEITYSSQSDTWTDFKYFPSGKYFYSITKSSGNVISGQKLEFNTTKKIYRISGTLENSLWESMSAMNIRPEVILAYADVFAWQIDFLTDPRKGDIFKLIYEAEVLDKKNTVISTKILACQYITHSSSFTAIKFTNNRGIEGYFNENGKSVKRAFLKAPLQFTRISSFFTKKRFHPILKYYRAHEGIDYAAPLGTPVSAIGDGIVKKSQYSGGFGNLIIIRHPNGYESYYGHLSKYARGIKKGARVKQGQLIAYVGSTGLSTGPHLDFRMKTKRGFINFLKMKTPPSITLSGQNREKFLSEKDTVLKQLEEI
ncbi:MAG: peptidoglycan DD-metalloendopeptidase family protein [Endomicrobiaceae bacterium]